MREIGGGICRASYHHNILDERENDRERGEGRGVERERASEITAYKTALSLPHSLPALFLFPSLSLFLSDPFDPIVFQFLLTLYC